MTKERYIDEDLRAIADGRLHLNVRHGIALPVSMIIRAADEIQSLRAQLAEARDKALEEAAQALDFYMREGGFKALTASERIRAMKGLQP